MQIKGKTKYTFLGMGILAMYVISTLILLISTKYTYIGMFKISMFIHSEAFPIIPHIVRSVFPSTTFAFVLHPFEISFII